MADSASLPYPTTADAGYDVQAVDVDAHDKLELVSAHDNADQNNPVSELSVLAPNANGEFTAVSGSPFSFGTLRATGLALGDFDADAQPDFATSDSKTQGRVGVLLNTLAGRLTPAPGAVRFGTLGFGSSATSPLQLANTGTGFSRLARISLRGANPADFT